MRRSRLSLAVLVAVGGMLLALPINASAAKVTGGNAKITLAPAFQQSLAAKGVTVSPTGVAKRAGNRLKLKVRRGRVNRKRRRANLRLGGGIGFSRSSPRATSAGSARDVTLTRLAVAVRKGRGRVTAVFSPIFDERRMLLLSLDTFNLSDVKFRRQGRRITAKVSLARGGARELSQALGLKGDLRFRPGERVGQFTVTIGGTRRARRPRQAELDHVAPSLGPSSAQFGIPIRAAHGSAGPRGT